MEPPLVALTLVAVLGCGLSAGVFFAFSGFVMKALARLPAAQGIAAMQAINVAAVSVAFMLALSAPRPPASPSAPGPWPNGASRSLLTSSPAARSIWLG